MKNQYLYEMARNAVRETYLWFWVIEKNFKDRGDDDCPICLCEAPYHSGMCPYLKLKESFDAFTMEVPDET